MFGDSTVIWVSVLLSLSWLIFGTLLARAARQIAVLRESIDPRPDDPAVQAPVRNAPPSLSVVVTARDEAGGIETTVHRLLEQRYRDLQLIVVDDRSTDGTGAILDRLQSEAGHARLTVLHVRELPSGWLGKCHACRLGAEQARGDWVLFLDGDVELQEDDTLARVVALAEQRRLDHVTLIPDQSPVSPLQQALVTVFAQMYLLAARVYEMDRDYRRGGVGIGAFNLVRRAAYDRIGGHSLLRMDLADDYKLGRLLKESGARQRLLDGAGLVRCPWHRGALNVARGLEKNLFAGFDYSVLELAGFTLLTIILVFGPLATAFLGTSLAMSHGGALQAAASWTPLFLEVATVGLGFRRQSLRHGGNPVLLTLLYPAAVTLLLGAAWNSALVALVRGGVRWRDTFYPLRELRAGRVRAGVGRGLGML